MKHIDKFAQFGIAATIPGLQYAVELLQQHLDLLKNQVNDEEITDSKTRKPNTYWSKLTPEQRSLELSRRNAVRHQNEKKAARIAAGKKRWTNMSKAQQQAHLAKMRAGKKRSAA